MATTNPSTSVTESSTAVREALADAAGVLRRPVEAAAFWAAIALPFLHLPLLVSGFQSGNELAAFAALLALNVLALVVGHDHRRR